MSRPVALKGFAMYFYDKSKNMEVITFDSMNEQVEAVIETAKCRPELNKAGYLGPGVKSFVGELFYSFEDVKTKANNPWIDGLRLIESMADKIRDTMVERPRSIKRKMRFSEDDGDDVDYDRLRSGNAYWRTTSRQKSCGSQVVTMAVDVCSSSYRKADSIMWRGAACLAAADVLEEAGYQTNIWTYSRCGDGYKNGRSSLVLCNIKEQYHSLDMGSLACSISGWFYRTITFGSYWVAPSTPTSLLGDPSRLGDCWQYIGQSENEIVVVDGVWDESAATAKARDIIAQVNQLANAA